MQRIYFSLLFFCLLFFIDQRVLGQTRVKGVVKDGATGETVVGATIIYSEGKGTVTDIDGNFSFELPNGEYTITVSFVGFTPQKSKIKAVGSPITLSFTLQSMVLDEVEIVADVAKIRETPVAFSAITPLKIQEELGSRDIPMILNTTPGVYATESGGGSGDARISIRGFSQRNVAVMVDGIPVNDMENGNVFWSNWDGLGDITKSMQLQRGLGASKLAITSVGGTMNVITKGIDDKLGISLKQEVGNNGQLKTGLSYNSGLLKGNWGFVMAGTYKRGNGWVDQTWSEAWSYFFKVQKRFGEKHLLTLGVNGAPQKHAQRSWKLPIAVLDREYAEKLGINADSALKYDADYGNILKYTISGNDTSYQSLGKTYNPNWGVLNRGGINENVSTSLNAYHKPLFNLSHFYNINSKANLSTVTYASFGDGGGTGFNSGASSAINRDSLGLFNLQPVYDYQITKINPLYSNTETLATRILRSSKNNHQWFGLLSSFNYRINNSLSYTGGLDIRTYKGEHYREITDLIGGDYYINQSDQNQPKMSSTDFSNKNYYMKRIGDKIDFNYNGYVNWGGLFSQLELKKGRWTGFVTASFAQNGYKRVDHFAKKDIVLSDTTLSAIVGWGDTLYVDGTNYVASVSNSKFIYNGDTIFVISGKDTSFTINPTKYTIESSEARVATSDWHWFSTYTIKTGANFNVTEHQNVFINIGYLTMPQPFNNVFLQNAPNKLYNSFDNQKVFAFELGYGLTNRKYALNANSYYTVWENKPMTKTGRYQGDNVTYNMTGLNALHKGIEVDYVYRIIKQLDIEGAIAFADWKYVGNSSTYILDQNFEVLANLPVNTDQVHVGDAAQFQFTSSLKFEPVKNLYFKPRVTYFGKNYADFLPVDLSIDEKGNTIEDPIDDVWMIPNYTLVDLYAGYEFKYQKMRFNFTAAFINLLDASYITDALSAGPDFSANSATVYMGQGRRFNTSLKISF